MQAEIICIGDELLIGQTINTNAAWMGELLNKHGLRIHRATSIADSREEIITSLDEASSRSQVVLITGGLGPTKDDITKKTLCEYFDSGLVMNEESLARITGFFKGRGLPMLDVNRDQALMPQKCRVIQNHRGTACGMWFERNGVVFVSMPGVPFEMQAMMEEEIMPSLVKHFQRPEITHRTILTMGIGESFLASKIEKWEDSLADHGIKLAYLPSPGMVKLRMSSYEGIKGENARDTFAQKEKELTQLIGDYIFGYEKETIQQIIGRLLLERKETVVTAESCTGGMISHLITGVPGSSGYFKGGIISYANELKTNDLGIKKETIDTYNVVSQQVAKEMASGAQKKWNTTWAVSATGIAGPDGGTEKIPVGTVWIAVAGPKRIISACFQLGRSRERTISITADYSLNMLRKEILALNG